MTSATRRGIKEGIGFGIIAGILFAIMEVVAAAGMGDPPLMPLRMFASIVLGSAALETVGMGTAFLVGSLVHLVLSGVYGLVYGVVNARLPTKTRTGWASQAGIGLAFGAVLWLFNFQIVARILFPWFLMAPQLTQLLLHALFFGLPLGLMYAAAERRVHHGRRVPSPA
jgi:hypothetical protein